MQKYNTTAYEGEMTLWWKLPQYLDLTAGLYYRHAPKISTYIDVPSVPLPSLQKATQRLQTGDALISKALFSQVNYYPNDRWKWVAGLRLEQVLGYEAFAEYGENPEEYQSTTFYYDDQDVSIIPRLAAIYTPNEKHTFKWMYGKAINTPAFSQNRIEPGLPKTKLVPEQVETFEFDYLTYLSPNYLFSLDLFHSRLKNLFEQTIVANASGEYSSFLGNAGLWSTNGIELSLQAQPTRDTELEFSVIYQKTRDRQRPERKVAYSPNLLGQFKFSYQWTPQLNLGLTAYCVSDMEVFFDETLQNSDGSFGQYVSNTHGKGYVITGANVRFQDWLKKGIFVNLRINNIFDKEVVYPTYTMNTWMDRGAVGEERSFLLTIGYGF